MEKFRTKNWHWSPFGNWTVSKLGLQPKPKGFASVSEAKRHLTKLTQKMQLESCVRALEQLAAQEDNPILSGALEYYRRNQKLTTKYAAVIFWKLQAFRIDHHPTFFKIELRRDKHIEDLRQMPTRRVHRFWGALSTAQRRKAQELGHISPG